MNMTKWKETSKFNDFPKNTTKCIVCASVLQILSLNKIYSPDRSVLLVAKHSSDWVLDDIISCFHQTSGS